MYINHLSKDTEETGYIGYSLGKAAKGLGGVPHYTCFYTLRIN